ncbi:hypothetical protein QJS10_CPA16g00553 [Acorus calamus]|uniref:Uncharacterized protein n=1 Tax=Acorus calamus TaxID=4465 RepID=A0AAV9D3I9_ACOCL|nr:hypothetical protein QJS10_CPA16g00553 [Acorus calamus]
MAIELTSPLDEVEMSIRAIELTSPSDNLFEPSPVQMVEEQKLAEKHDEMLNSNYQKYQMTVAIDGSLRRLACHYKINLSD